MPAPIGGTGGPYPGPGGPIVGPGCPKLDSDPMTGNGGPMEGIPPGTDASGGPTGGPYGGLCVPICPISNGPCGPHGGAVPVCTLGGGVLKVDATGGGGGWMGVLGPSESPSVSAPPP